MTRAPSPKLSYPVRVDAPPPPSPVRKRQKTILQKSAGEGARQAACHACQCQQMKAPQSVLAI